MSEIDHLVKVLQQMVQEQRATTIEQRETNSVLRNLQTSQGETQKQLVAVIKQLNKQASYVAKHEKSIRMCRMCKNYSPISDPNKTTEVVVRNRYVKRHLGAPRPSLAG